MIPRPDPVVVYLMVTALIVVLAVGIFFASPLRELVTGPDTPDGDAPSDGPAAGGPWSTAPPQPDDNWPPRPGDS